MAEAPVENLRKILELERARGFADTAVIGGLDTFLRRLLKANRSAAGTRLRKALQGTHLKKWTALSLIRSDFRDRALPWSDLIMRSGHTVNDRIRKLLLQ